MEEKKARQVFTPERKFEILKDIQTFATVKEGLAKHPQVGVRTSLCNSRPIKPAELKRLEAENRKLKEVVLNQFDHQRV